MRTKYFTILAIFVLLTAQAFSQIVNGNFESGNTGFESDYIYCNTQNDITQGKYAVDRDPNWYYFDFTGSDHTSGSGKFLFANGTNSIAVWRQTVNVSPNSDYYFVYWLCSICDYNTARMQLKINGTNVGNVKNAPSSLNYWVKDSLIWNSGSSTTARLELIDNNSLGSGNDFGIDDIVFKRISCSLNISITINGSTNLCKGDTVQLSVRPDSSTYTYLWSNGKTSRTINVTDSGYYLVRVSNRYGCTDSAGIRVFVNPKPKAKVTATSNIICKGDAVQLSAAPDSSTYSYLWSNGKTTRTINVTDSGYYSVRITNRYGCSDTAGFRINIYPKPKPKVTSSETIICQGNPIELSATPDSASYKYYWSNGNTTRNITASDSGYYTVRVTNRYGCSDTAGIRINIYPKTQIKIIASDTILCKGNSIQLSALPDSSIYQYYWSTGETKRIINITDSGYYLVRITNEYGCSDTAGIRIKQYPKPNFKILTTQDEICKGDSAVLSVNTDEKELIYEWSNGSTSKSIIVSDSGYYYVKVTNKYGCSNTDVIKINLYPKPIFNITATQTLICKGDTAIITVNSENSNLTYEWSNGSTNKTIAVTDSGFYSVTVFNEYGCSDSAVIQIQINPKLIFTINASKEVICKGESTTLTVISEDTDLSYEWSNGENTKSIIVNDSGYYFVKVTNQLGCSDSAGIRIDIFRLTSMDITTSQSDICKGDSVVITINSNETDLTYEWSNGKTTKFIIVNDSGYYSVKVTNHYGCSDTTGIRINLYPKPIFNLIASQTEICEGDTATITVNSEDTKLVYDWSNGENTKSINLTQKGYYLVKVTNKYGCSDTAGIRINFYPKPIFQVEATLTEICKGDITFLFVKSNDTGLTYEWSDGAKTPSIIVSDSGYYFVKVTNAYGCSDTAGIKINLNPTISVAIDTLHTAIRNSLSFINYFITLNNNLFSRVSDIYLHISFDASSFLPDETQSNLKRSYIDDNNQRNMIFEFNDLVNANQVIINNKIYGMVLLGNKSMNPIKIIDFHSNYNETCIESKEGLIYLDSICSYSLRGVQMFNQTVFNINPNPANCEEVELEFSGDEEGTHTLTFYNIQGVKIETIQWENQRNSNKSFMLDMKKYSDCLYYIILKTPWSLISKPLTIVK